MTLNPQHLLTALRAQDPGAALPAGLSAALSGVADLGAATATELCFAERADQAAAVGASRAQVVVVPLDFPELPEKLLIRCANPRQCFFAIAALFLPPAPPAGIHPGAHIDPSAVLGAGISIGAGTVVGANTSIGARCIIATGVQIGEAVEIGPDCVIEPNVTIMRGSRIGARCALRAGAVIGSDGFGFAWDGQAHRKVPQLGRVVLEDDVDIGCNSCVDRATLSETRVRRGTKIDNLVQIGHNVELGEHTIMASQSGVAGSSRLGNGVIVAGQVAITDHVEVGAGALIGGQSGVTKDIPAGAKVFGTPARDMQRTMRELAALAQLPALLRQVRRQERELAALRARLASSEEA
ncbi:UDP-3-O-(3-hydroxymyristoyl)glucosamine N-acyltransferase [Thiohalocapsa sp. ML1]|jgi:UDP-3-O-[3-hydroxymyristoyl] glucosamine N-acyltransferase|uniref:UDP-3-O-(3-hydroxymyristoyl)glucosamine N-acyltransferase n=1 Tax=Thiohalocapsa sp. ML1 TaxID=1431688 RepID=UPI000731FD1E|nr:UDP-3-O-(3-hydroxymyristoyl)glucosamine N-acyltransferase [Thiohalocapsa sp. ML1]